MHSLASVSLPPLAATALLSALQWEPSISNCAKPLFGERAWDVQAPPQSQSLPTCRAQAARQARQAGQSDKRRKMQQDLAKREEAWQTERSAEQQASSRLKVGCKVCWGRQGLPV